ncbi:MAG: DNA replication complex GINS family protein [Candidatus Hodarchaeaceae archaeon]|nr:DNA replication complex GINS family protein [Candidatus Hodarchaeaceae archaeon]
MGQRVRVIKDLPAIKLVGRQIGPLVAGQEAEFEPWEAGVLERHGYIEPIQRLTTIELRKLVLVEERSHQLEPLPPDFYSSIAQQIAYLRATGQQDKVEEFQSAVDALLEVRVQKLLQSALSPASAENLPPEEKFLVNRLAIALEGWSQWLSKLFEKKAGEEAGKHDEEFGGNIRDVVGNETNIQKQGVPAPNLYTRGTTTP